MALGEQQQHDVQRTLEQDFDRLERAIGAIDAASAEATVAADRLQ